MKRIGLLLLLLSSLAWGQGGYQVGVTQGIAVQSNGVGYVQVLPLASIRVCQDGATGTPCAPAATIYTDRTLGTPLGSNVVISDTGGNYAWFAPPGWYQEQISAPGQTTLTRPVLVSADLGNTGSSGTGLVLKQTSPTILTPAITNPAITGGGTWGGGPAFSGGGSWLGGPTINSPILITPSLGVATGTSLNLGATGTLATTAQSGSGSLCMTTNCVMATPSVTGGLFNRMRASLGTALVSGDFAASAGFGNTATITPILGTDSSFSATVSSSGTGQSANPTLTLTFHDGTWTNSPICVPATGPNNDTRNATWAISAVSATALILQLVDTPVAGSHWGVSVKCEGR